MAEATHLTQQGQLQAATQAIQRALRHGSANTLGAREAAAPSRSPGHVVHEGMVLDGYTRVVSDERGDAAVHDEKPSPTRDARGSVQDAVQPSRADTWAQPEQWLDADFTHQGRTLRYKLYIPPSASGSEACARPMVMMLHGCTQNAADFAGGTQMNALARQLGVVVLYPEQTQRANAQKCWNWFKPQHQQRGRGEPALLAALALSVAAQHKVDTRRIYVAGLSAGGAMADIMGRCYPDVFAAVGVHSGLPTGAANDVVSALAVMRNGASTSASASASATHSGAASRPTIVFHGDADHTVHVNNGAAIIEAARAARGRDVDDTLLKQQQGQSAAGQRYTRSVESDAAGTSHTEYWQLHGAGHAWSGGSPQGSYTNAGGVDASREMLRFFLLHSRPH